MTEKLSEWHAMKHECIMEEYLMVTHGKKSWVWKLPRLIHVLLIDLSDFDAV